MDQNGKLEMEKDNEKEQALGMCVESETRNQKSLTSCKNGE